MPPETRSKLVTRPHVWRRLAQKLRGGGESIYMRYNEGTEQRVEKTGGRPVITSEDRVQPRVGCYDKSQAPEVSYGFFLLIEFT